MPGWLENCNHLYVLAQVYTLPSSHMLLVPVNFVEALDSDLCGWDGDIATTVQPTAMIAIRMIESFILVVEMIGPS